MHTYIINANDTRLSTNSAPSTRPLSFTANPARPDGTPYGLVAVSGKVFNTLPDGLPVLVMHEDGGWEIKESTNAFDLAYAKYIISGSFLLVKNGERVLDVPSDPLTGLKLRQHERLHRLAIGTLSNQELLVVENECTLFELQATMYYLGADNAMMTAVDDVFLSYPRGGVQMGKQPITTLAALAARDLPHPIIVIDAGHGGSDPGACGQKGLHEADVNLLGAQTMWKVLSSGYEGTFLLTRNEDRTLSLQERTDMANAIGADYFFSCHSNSNKKIEAHGYEVHVHPTTSKTNKAVAKAVHDEGMRYLQTLGITDRGVKESDFHVLRETNCRACLVEMLFISNEHEEDLLKLPDFVKKIYTAHAVGLAAGLGLSKKVSAVQQTENDGKLYRVQVGAYKYRAGADETLEKLKNAGVEGIITRY